MTKERKITLNAEKRKVIADQFQSFYEDKVKQKLIDAKEQYDLMREKAKVAIDKVVRFHQPQEDVDTIRSMIKKITIIWCSNKQKKKTYKFKTEEQLKYFMMGVDEAEGWLSYEIK